MAESLSLKLGIGGVINGELITFDFISREKDLRLNPYLCEITGRDFKYGFKRTFVDKNYTNYIITPYGHKMKAMTFRLERYKVYEYKRFAGDSMGEIIEGYFVVMKDKIIELDYDEIMHWVGTAKEKEKSSKSGQARMIFGNDKKFAKDDIDF